MPDTHLLLRPETTVLVVIDLQEKLMPAIEGADAVLANAKKLLHLAKTLNLKTLVTTQNRKGLGPTLPEIEELAGVEPIDKVSFGCLGDDSFRTALERATSRGSALLMAGVETHVCVMQTALGALADGYLVHVASDASGSRTAANRAIGLERMRQAGAVMSSTEMAIFELLGNSSRAEFKQMLAHLK